VVRSTKIELVFVCLFVVPAAYESTSKKGLSGGAIAGIAVGAAAVMTLVTGLILFFFYRRRKLPPALLAQIERCKFFSLFVFLFSIFVVGCRHEWRMNGLVNERFQVS